MSETLYVYRWDRQGRKNEICRILARGKMNSCLAEFEDGYQMITSRNAFRRLKPLSPASSPPSASRSIPSQDLSLESQPPASSVD
jgi:hypothetical protein